MKVALCLSGEMRIFDQPQCYETLKKYILEPLKPDIFISTWDHRGKSLWSKKVGIGQDNEFEPITVDMIRQYIPFKDILIENYEEWVANLPENIRGSLGAYVGSSIPDLYGVYRANLLSQSGGYNLVIRARPDNYYEAEIPEKTLENLDVVWHQNCEPAHYPNRLYTILYWSNQMNMNKLTAAYTVQETLWNEDVGTSLSSLDPCKNMAVQAKKCGIELRSIDKPICEVHR